MNKELYIVGDQSRLVVKNIINQFKETGYALNIYAPEDEEVDRLPNFSIHLIILVSDGIDFSIIKKIVSYQKKYDYHLCLRRVKHLYKNTKCGKFFLFFLYYIFNVSFSIILHLYKI